MTTNESEQLLLPLLYPCPGRQRRRMGAAQRARGRGISRGSGRWQRLLLHELYYNPKVAPSGNRYIYVTDYASTPSELSAVYRAARALRTKGWVDTSIIRHTFVSWQKSGGSRLDALPQPPAAAVSVRNVTNPLSCEHS